MINCIFESGELNQFAPSVWRIGLVPGVDPVPVRLCDLLAAVIVAAQPPHSARLHPCFSLIFPLGVPALARCRATFEVLNVSPRSVGRRVGSCARAPLYSPRTGAEGELLTGGVPSRLQCARRAGAPLRIVLRQANPRAQGLRAVQIAARERTAFFANTANSLARKFVVLLRVRLARDGVLSSFSKRRRSR